MLAHSPDVLRVPYSSRRFLRALVALIVVFTCRIEIARRRGGGRGESPTQGWLHCGRGRRAFDSQPAQRADATAAAWHSVGAKGNGARGLAWRREMLRRQVNVASWRAGRKVRVGALARSMFKYSECSTGLS